MVTLPIFNILAVAPLEAYGSILLLYMRLKPRLLFIVALLSGLYMIVTVNPKQGLKITGQFCKNPSRQIDTQHSTFCSTKQESKHVIIIFLVVRIWKLHDVSIITRKGGDIRLNILRWLKYFGYFIKL